MMKGRDTMKIVIIGGGIVGCFLAHDLSRYDIDITLIERQSDLCDEVSSANSAIIHAGYDPEDHTLKALLNKKGADMYPAICEQLNVDYKRIGAYVVAAGKEEEETLSILYERGIKRGVRMEWLSKEVLHEKEPNISSQITKALSVPDTAIITPWEMGLTLIQEAVCNGLKLHLEESVEDIKKIDERFHIITNKAAYDADVVINAAGLGSAAIMRMIEDKPLFEITPKRGQYFILSKHATDFVHHVLYPVPGKAGKGVLCVPTCHGNILLGPNSEVLNEQDNSTSAQGLQEVSSKLQKTVTNIPYGEIIHSYAGLRPCGNHNDFFIQASPLSDNFIHLGCIDSPGLASAPAISAYVIDQLILSHHELKTKELYRHYKRITPMKDLTPQQKENRIKKQPAYGHIICRCENISEQEVVDCIHEPCGARTIKEIKKRIRPGMGKCQGGFCEIEVAKILARELQIPLKEVRYDKTSYFMTNKGGD